MAARLSKVFTISASLILALFFVACGGVAQGSMGQTGQDTQAPTISWFTASPIGAGLNEATIVRGQSAVLQYSFRNGQGSISPTVGAVISEVSSTVSPTVSTTYTLTVSNGSTQDTKTATVNVNEPPVITAQPTPTTTLPRGGSVTLAVTATTKNAVTYQWKNFGMPISGATSNTLALSNVQPDNMRAWSGSYTCDVTNTLNGTRNTTTSNPANVYVNATSVVSDLLSVTKASGQTHQFNFVVVGTGVLTYQWYLGGTAIPGATSSTYTTGTPGVYTAIATNTLNATTTTLSSSAATLTIVNPPTITTQPIGSSILVNNPLTLTVSATGSGTLTYQWFKNGSPISGATSSTYTVSSVATSNAGTYYCVVSNTLNSVSVTTQSTSVNITVLSTPLITYPQPSYTLLKNSSFTVSATNTGSPATAWSISPSLPTGLVFNTSTGTISGTPTALIAATMYTVTATNANGGNTFNLTLEVIDSPAILTFEASPKKISKGSVAGLNISYTGGTATVSPSVSGLNSGKNYLSLGVFNTVGVYNYNLAVTNSAGITATATAVLTVVDDSTVNKYQVDTNGTITPISTPISNLPAPIVAPATAVKTTTILTLMSDTDPLSYPTAPAGHTAISPVLTITSSNGYPFVKPLTFRLDTNASISGLAMVYMVDSSGLTSVGIKQVNSGSIDFTTTLPGTYVAYDVTSALTTVNTGFNPAIDSFFQPNQGTYTLPGSASLGMTGFASWYWSNKSTLGQGDLYAQWKEGNLASPSDDINAQFMISRLGIGTSLPWQTLYDQQSYTFSNLVTGKALIHGMNATGKPQILLMNDSRTTTTSAVAVIVYSWNASTNKFGIYDPNYPGTPLTITWNPTTGAFTSYDRSAGYSPSLANYAFEGTPSIHRTSDYQTLVYGANYGFPTPPFAGITLSTIDGQSYAATNGVMTIPNATNIPVTGSIVNGNTTQTDVNWRLNNGAGTASTLSSNSFSFTIPALIDPVGTLLTIETLDDPYDITFSYSGLKYVTLKQTGAVNWFDANFEDGTLGSWSTQWGYNPGYSSGVQSITNNSPRVAVVSTGNDPLLSSLVKVFAGTYALRINDQAGGAYVDQVIRTITVPSTANPTLKFNWSALLEAAGHGLNDQPYADIIVEDLTTSQTIYSQHFAAGDPAYPGWINTGGWSAIPWQTVSINLSGRSGNSVRITIRAADCSFGGHGGYIYFDAQ